MQHIMQVNATNKTMSSREIAELCDKEHRHVCRDIDSLNESYEQLTLPKVEQGYYTHPNTGSQQHRQFLLTQEQCVDLITGYNREIRIRINRRWAELEQKAAQPQIPQTFAEALQLAADQALRIEQDKPKVEFFDTVASRDNLMTVTQVATKLGLSAQALNKKLATLGAYDARIKRCKTFTSDFIAKGYGKMKVGSTGHDQGLITQAGQAWIVGLFGETNE